MPVVPAFCDTCGTAFSSGLLVENSYGIEFSGCQAGPCPSCGGMGHVPDGVFNFVGATIEIVSAPGRTRAELATLAEILRAARRNRASQDIVQRQIDKQVPALAPLFALFPANRSEWYAFLAVLLAVVQIYLAAFPPSPQGAAAPPAATFSPNEVTKRVLEEDQGTMTKPPPKKAGKKVGRNEPCPCGSGKKYKKCCLATR